MDRGGSPEPGPLAGDGSHGFPWVGPQGFGVRVGICCVPGVLVPGQG